MKLTSVEIHSPNFPTIITLSFRDPLRADSYNIKTMTGLDADEIISKYYGTATNSNTKFNSLAVAKREVVLQISLNPMFTQNETYSALRDTLYKMISSARTGRVELHFKNGTNTVAILYGYIAKFEAPTSEPVPEVQLTVKCDEPFLIAPTPVNVPVAGLPFNRFSIQDDNSTAPHGFSFEIKLTATVNRFITISDPDDPSWFFKITPPFAWLVNDILKFSSEYNNRYLTCTRASDGSVSHMADSIGAGSVWPIIFPGENTFSFDYFTGLSWTAMSYSYHYWGV